MHGKPKTKAHAISIDELIQMSWYLSKLETLTAKRNNALIQIGFFGAMRRSELVNIKFEDITFLKEGIEILIPKSKTDTTGAGAIIFIPKGNEKICPVRALNYWLNASKIESGALFRPITKYNTVDASKLSDKSVNDILKETAEKAGLSNSELVSGHSLRRGFATAAFNKDINLIDIMRQGRWQSQQTMAEYVDKRGAYHKEILSQLID